MTDPLPPIDVALLEALTEIVARAAAAILAVPRADLATTTKADNSPVTAADLAADTVISEGLARLLPHLPVISEERCDGTPAPSSTCALVDPLDGTKDFVAGRGEFTVNLALIRDGRPVAGIVAAPASGELFRGAEGLGAEKLQLSGSETRPGGAVPIRTRRAPSGNVIAVVSRSHLDAATIAYLQLFPVARQIAIGSSLKLCRLAEGAADLYPRLSPLSEWDLAAGHAVLAAAGGLVTAPDGRPLLYGTHTGLRIPGFLAWGDPALAKAV